MRTLRQPSTGPGTVENLILPMCLVTFKPWVSVWAGFCGRVESTPNWAVKPVPLNISLFLFLEIGEKVISTSNNL